MNIQDIKDLAPWVSSGIAFATLFINTLPKFKAWCRKEQKRIRLNRFFHDLKDGLPSRYSYHGSETLKVSNYSEAIKWNKDPFSIRFFYYQKVFFNENESAKLNGVGLKVGYHLYEIISVLLQIIRSHETLGCYFSRMSSVGAIIQRGSKIAPK